MMQKKLIPSFGRRKVRKLKRTSQKAYEGILPLLKLDPSKNIFEHMPPEVWLEIGFGGGEHMLEQLIRHPSIAIVGCEPFMNGVAKLLTKLSPDDYERVRIWHEDVRLILEKLPFGYFTRAFILFPDPWPKKRHYHRRLITKEFMRNLEPKLQKGAFLHIASDDVSYVEHIQEALYNDPHFILLQGPSSSNPSTWQARPEGWPPTRYEQKATNLGKKCAYMLFQKR